MKQHPSLTRYLLKTLGIIFCIVWPMSGMSAVLEDSFEQGHTPGAFPAGWGVPDQDAHADATGPRIVDDSSVKIADGKFAVKVVSKPDKSSGKDGKMNRDFEAVAQGQLSVWAMVPKEQSGFLSVELRTEKDRLFSLELHPSGKFRYRDANGENQETGVNYTLDTWYHIVIAWDANASLWHAFFLDEQGANVRITPEAGVGFLSAQIGKVPSRVEIRVNRADDGPKVGYVDAFTIETTVK